MLQLTVREKKKEEQVLQKSKIKIEIHYKKYEKSNFIKKKKWNISEDLELF